jgi:hypothetical protein
MTKHSITCATICAVATTCAPGCAFFARAGVGPVIDTEGEAGFEVAVTVGFGSSDGAFATSTVVTSGGDGEDATRNSSVGLETSGKFSDKSAGHFGIGYRSRDVVGDHEEETLRGVSLRAGVGYALSRREKRSRWLVDSMRAIVLGVEVEAGYLWGEEGRALFGFPVYLELYRAN